MHWVESVHLVAWCLCSVSDRSKDERRRLGTQDDSIKLVDQIGAIFVSILWCASEFVAQ